MGLQSQKSTSLLLPLTTHVEVGDYYFGTLVPSLTLSDLSDPHQKGDREVERLSESH